MKRPQKWLSTLTLAFITSSLFTSLAFSGVAATFNQKFIDDIPKRVAIIPQDEGSFDVMELAGVVTSVLMSLDFEVMERTSLDLLLKEYKISLSGLLVNHDPEIGKLLNIDGIVVVSRSSSSYSRPETTSFKTGQMTNYNFNVTNASVRLIDIYSGAIVYQFN